MSLITIERLDCTQEIDAAELDAFIAAGWAVSAEAPRQPDTSTIGPAGVEAVSPAASDDDASPAGAVSKWPREESERLAQAEEQGIVSMEIEKKVKAQRKTRVPRKHASPKSKGKA